MTTDFGKRLRAARKHAKLTQKELAALVGMSQSNLSELETSAFGSSMSPQLADACRVSASWLATGDGTMHLQETMLVREPSSGYAPPSLALALPVVIAAIARVPALRWNGIASMLASAVGHPDLCKELCDELLPLLEPRSSKVAKQA